MSNIKRSFMPEEYTVLDYVADRATLQQEAKHSVCSCWYYDLANSIEDMTDEELKAVISDPYHIHKIQDAGEDWQTECAVYQMELAENIKDAQREDGNA